MGNKGFILAATALMMLFACNKDGWKRDYSDSERAVLDKVVGKYELTDVSWSEGDIDLNNDGIASDLFDEMSEGTILWGNCVSRVDMRSSYTDDYDGRASVVIPVCDFYNSIGFFWQYESFYVHFNVTGGYFSWIGNTSLNSDKDFTNAAIDWSGDGKLTVSGDTRFRDYAIGKNISGRVTYTYTCVSGKGKSN